MRKMLKTIPQKTIINLGLIVVGLFVVAAFFNIAMVNDVMGVDICDEYTGPNRELVGCGDKSGEEIVNSTAQNILTALIWFGGVAAVIFIVVGGIQLVTSEGDPAKVKKGRNTILFSIIGLVIALLATVIVKG